MLQFPISEDASKSTFAYKSSETFSCTEFVYSSIWELLIFLQERIGNHTMVADPDIAAVMCNLLCRLQNQRSLIMKLLIPR